MTLFEFVGTAAIPVTILSSAAILLIGLGLTTKKSRTETAKLIQSMDFGSHRFSSLAVIWASYFQKLFGKRLFARRQLLSIPLYTLTVSGIFFLTWISYLYLFRNSTHSFTSPLPLNIKQAIHDFYHEGIYAALLIDVLTIQFTKTCIKVGAKFGYYSIRFLLLFFATFVFSYSVFSLSVFYFRIEDMVRLYIEFAPNDRMPVMPYSPISYLVSSISLFAPESIIHVTSRGWFATYFMPESLIFYCAATAQLSLIAIAIGFQISVGLDKFRQICLGFVTQIGTPKTNAFGVISFVILGLISMLLVGFSLFAIASG